jgi:hypothetical protein
MNSVVGSRPKAGGHAAYGDVCNWGNSGHVRCRPQVHWPCHLSEGIGQICRGAQCSHGFHYGGYIKRS